MKEFRRLLKRVVKISLILTMIIGGLNLNGFTYIEVVVSLVAKTTLTSINLIAENTSMEGIGTTDIYEMTLGDAGAFVWIMIHI